MDCSSPHAMASLEATMRPTPEATTAPAGEAAAAPYDVASGNDADADRHGIVTPDAGLMNPNHYLAVAIDYLFSHRDKWGNAGVGKTLVSSSLIDRLVDALGNDLVEFLVGLHWFVAGLSVGICSWTR